LEHVRPPADESWSRAPASSSALKMGRINAASIGCWSRRVWPRQSARKWTLQRCPGQPSTWAIAAFVHAVRDDQALTPDPAAVANLLNLRWSTFLVETPVT
jgi:hypothetical protein